MKLTFLGASGDIVTGSAYLLEHNNIKMLLDFGMFQGSKEIEGKTWEQFSFNSKSIDFVILTHAHLDHCGRLALLYRRGFRGKVISTEPTRDLAFIVLMDMVNLHKSDVEKGKFIFDQSIARPLVTETDVKGVISLFKTYHYGEKIDLDKEVSIRLRDAGHILGSASVELWFKNSFGRDRKIVFSGDVGQTGARIIKDPDYIREADYIVLESTYGSRLHKDKSSTVLELLSILNEVEEKQSVALIPVFALERAQEILYELNLLVEKRVLKNLTYYLDSPMAIKATRVFEKYREFYDEDAKDLVRNGDEIFHFNGLHFVEDPYESKMLKNKKGAVIMAGSGMCNGGRIVSHLKNALPLPENHIVIVGFQVEGTLGRDLVNGKRLVNIYGDDIPVRAKIHTLGGFSAHGDSQDLFYWTRNFGTMPLAVFITHGDAENRLAFSKKLENELQLSTYLPKLEESVELD